jgi:sulfoacetaldehyde acetyltransferase
LNTMTEAKNLATAAKRAFGKVRMGAPEAFVETLVAHQVKDVFGIIGSPPLDALDLLAGAGIRRVTVAQQQSAAHMADGYGRVSNRLAVCIAPDGPGFANCLTAVAAAYWARTPLVVVTPESGSLAAGHGSILEAGHAPIFSKITKWQTHVSSPLQLADLMHRAFTIALHERGPVHVSMSDEGLRGEGDYEIRAPLVIERAAGGARSLARAAQLLAEAKFPVIVSGEGVAIADGIDDVKALAEQLTAPVVSTYRHNDTFPASHVLGCGALGTHGSKAAMRILARADVVLALGTRLGGVPPRQDGESWREDVRIIQIDSDERTLGVASEVALAIHGDARLAARELLGHFKGRAARKPDKARLAEVQHEKEAWIAELASQPSPSRKGQIGARRALAQLAKALPRNAMVSTDVGNVCSLASSYLGFEQPASFLAAMGGASRGCAYPTALGAKLAQPERPAVAYVGEGAWAISLADVMTAVKEKIPVIAVVFNNSQWSAQRKGPVEGAAGRVAAHTAVPDFSEVARVMGAEGYRAEYEDEVADALKAALKSGKPSVVEIMVTPERGEIFGREGARKTRRPLSQQRETVAAG